MYSEKFRNDGSAPDHLATAPQTDKPPEAALLPGLEHRPFSDEEIKQAFDTFDLDKNENVGAMEIKHILDVIGEQATDEEIDEMIRMCDTDGAGQVTFEEFSKLMKQPAPPVPPAPPSHGKKSALRRNVSLAAPMPGETAPSYAIESTQQTRLISVETLIKKLSGGMTRMKPAQIKKIYKRFNEIDVDQSGAIDYKEFLMALEIDDSKTAHQMFNIFDMDGSGEVELKEFIVVLSNYTAAAKDEKLRFAFMMFDEDGSGFIERNELINMLRANFVIEAPSDANLEQRADRVFTVLNLPTDGQISYEDFMRLYKEADGLIYPITNEQRRLKEENSINAAIREAEA